MTGLFGKHLYFSIAWSLWLHSHDLCTALYQMMLIVHTWLTYVIVKYKQIMGMQQQVSVE
jgi:hypothetical protein